MSDSLDAILVNMLVNVYHELHKTHPKMSYTEFTQRLHSCATRLCASQAIETGSDKPSVFIHKGDKLECIDQNLAADNLTEGNTYIAQGDEYLSKYDKVPRRQVPIIDDNGRPYHPFADRFIVKKINELP